MFERFTSDARQVVVAAREQAVQRGDGRIRPLHLLYGLVTIDGVAARVLAGLGVSADVVGRELGGAPLSPAPEGDDSDAAALRAIGIDIEEIRRKVEENFGEGALDRAAADSPGGRIRLTGESKAVLALALREARSLHHTHLGTEHLLLAVLRLGKGNKFGDFTPATLRALRIDPDEARQHVVAELAHR